VRKALSILLDEKLIEKRQDSGSYIAPSAFPGAVYSDTIAFLLPEASGYLAARWIGDAQAVLNAAGYSIQVYSTENRASREREILQLLLKKPVRGLLVHGVRTAFPNPNIALYESLMAQGTSVVFLEAAYPELSASCQVSPDDFSGGELLARHLIALGHKKIAGIFRLDDQNGHKRYAGVLHALNESHLLFDDRNFLWYDPMNARIPDSRQFLSFIQIQLLDCTAVVCQNHAVAAQLMRELERFEIPVPQRISLAAFDTMEPEGQNTPGITCAVCSGRASWNIATELLLAQMEGRSAVSVSCPWELVRSDSTAPPE
ncbi:MAG: substrate-binding domain-containing protein, partial [Lachnospiraceae bacterium]|nr:substrate-binding domain-containing protein [Lachnospiraceae bacterium]